MSVAAHVLVALVRAYRATLARLLPPSCRFEPSCSRFAEEAVRRHGAVRGTRLTVGRLFRCRPGAEGGYDPVPVDSTDG